MATDGVPAEVRALSVDVLFMDDLALLLKSHAGWTEDVGSVNPVFFDMGTVPV